MDFVPSGAAAGRGTVSGRMRLSHLPLLLVALAIAAPLAAQRRGHRTTPPHCTTGVLCGNACIPVGRQCHVGDALPTAAAPAAPTVTRAPARDENGRIRRSEAVRREFLRATGHPNGWPGHVVDHVVPLCAGGADDPSNMQWQTVGDAKAKDRQERATCAARRH